MGLESAHIVRKFPTLRNVATRLAIYHAYGILVPDKAGPINQGRLHRGCTTSRVVQKIKEKTLQLEIIAAALVERVASARGIACHWMWSVCLLCTLSHDYCASLSQNPIIKNSKY